MTTSTLDFPTWFYLGCYGGLACCILAIAANALYTTLRRHGTTRQLVGAIIACAISALLLLPTFAWYNIRFTAQPAILSVAEIGVILGYIALWGWLLPLGITAAYYLYGQPRTTTTSVHIPRAGIAPAASPRHSELSSAYVFGEDTPWGWLEYRSGNFMGQRLALKRALATIGRDEDNDIWIDDEMASRHHAELYWESGKIYIADCESLNGVLLNERRIRHKAEVKSGDVLKVGSQTFAFIKAEQRQGQDEEFDPLANHKWVSVADSLTQDSSSQKSESVQAKQRATNERNQGEQPPLNLPHTDQILQAPVQPGATKPDLSPEQASPLPPTRPLLNNQARPTNSLTPAPETSALWEPMPRPPQATPHPLPGSSYGGALLIRRGSLAGKSFLLDRPTLVIGSSPESDIVFNEIGLAGQHIQFLHREDGDYVHDLTQSRNVFVNNVAVHAPRLLRQGDLIASGNLVLEYHPWQTARTIRPEFIIMPQPSTGQQQSAGPARLKLPIRPKEL
ncbi:FHA domain-containing protein [Ktedonosporobacter rubrisoli]|uniref:FHA domain-containing protein n=1 Tax=Ktedonosporobacter rubrisoli TaxID=2509675 RepID=A0A4P6JW47_KTERU|nr:FHA domain-containing protein [Ktedonosporobacter rubrisoli]QBD79908.1 FHA domain-containing protein [Ktedonosporobacter rubrisoli]